MSLFERKLLLQGQLRFTEQTWTTPGDYSVSLPAGFYGAKLHGGGGAGGRSTSMPGGAGGAGIFGTVFFWVTRPTTLTFTVGRGGTGQGNGGAGGVTLLGGNYNGAAGGDGGRPTFLRLNSDCLFYTGAVSGVLAVINNNTYVAYGGGGGGGAGGQGHYGRNKPLEQNSGGGGGGGGAYGYVNGAVVSFAGAAGGTFFPNSGWSGAAGNAGHGGYVVAGNGGQGGHDSRPDGGVGHRRRKMLPQQLRGLAVFCRIC